MKHYMTSWSDAKKVSNLSLDSLTLRNFVPPQSSVYSFTLNTYFFCLLVSPYLLYFNKEWKKPSDFFHLTVPKISSKNMSGSNQ